MEKDLSIEAWRAQKVKGCVQKGVIPPKPGSARERELYERWLKGVKKLHSNE